jgi:hypothetical protein
MMSESTMSEHEMKYYGKVTKPSEERIREIYGDDISQFMNRKPKRSSGKHELTSQIDDIRNGRGKYAPTIKSKRPIQTRLTVSKKRKFRWRGIIGSDHGYGRWCNSIVVRNDDLRCSRKFS